MSRTLIIRDWGLGRSIPDEVMQSYLSVITKNPKAVIAALHSPVD
jgi:DNA-binding transcriptional regulator YiaG